MTSPQLVLGLSLRDDATFKNFYVGDNALVLTALQDCLSGAGESFIYLWGAKGVGCSHLLQACCHAMSERHPVVYLDLEEYEDFSPEILDGLDHMDLICLDHINAVLNRKNWEEALFHFYNRAREQGKRLIVSGTTLPSQLPCMLEDLRSRLAWGLTFQVKPLDDSQKLSALSMRAKNRGMILPEASGLYLLHHTSRNLSELFKTLDLLESASLVEQRRITVPFIKTVLSSIR
ncbi:MAG: DnaA regulatory inactivator Hda [Coxiellaceae bacterium]|nr:DnaA regulatory inactivator Hda [Coxiellaceae bacterium]